MTSGSPARRSATLLYATLAIAGAGGMFAHAAGQRPSAEALATPTPGTGVIVGQVVDAATGQPIPEAIVTMNGRPAAPLPGGGGTAPASPARPVAPGAGAPGATLPGLPGRGGAAPPDRVITGADGRFLFRDLAKGTYTFAATAGGYINGVVGQTRQGAPAQPIEIDDAARVLDAKIRLWKYASVSGTVVDDAGEPAVGTAVRLLRRQMMNGRARLMPAGQARTDDRGMYRISSVMPGDYVAVVPQTQVTMPSDLAESFMKSITSGGANQGPSMLDFVANGEPPPMNGVRVGDFLFASNGNAGALPPLSAEGRLMAFQTLLFPGTTSPAQASVLTVTSGEERTGVNFQLRLTPTVRISGIVSSAAGAPGNVAVRLFPVSNDAAPDTDFPVATTTSSADGRFTFLGVPPGQFLLRVQKSPPPEIPAEMASSPLFQMFGGGLSAGRGGPPPPPLYGNASVTVTNADVTDVAVVLREGAKVSGRIEFEGTTAPPAGQALQSMTIGLTSLEAELSGGGFAGNLGAQNNQAGRVAADGTFTTRAVPPGRYYVAPAGRGGGPAWTLKAAMLNGRDVSSEPLDLTDADAGGVVITYTDRTGQITGAIHAGATAPIDNALVVLLPADYRGWIRNGMSARRMASSPVSKTATFTLPRLLAGDYLIAAVPRDGVDLQDPASVEAIARVATRVTLAEAEQKTMDLSIATVVR
jgi:hypothetical protein